MRRNRPNAALVSEAKHSAKAGRLVSKPVFVPPVVLDEVPAVFHLPGATDARVKRRGGD
jgi:hypothetical protein